MAAQREIPWVVPTAAGWVARKDKWMAEHSAYRWVAVTGELKAEYWVH